MFCCFLLLLLFLTFLQHLMVNCSLFSSLHLFNWTAFAYLKTHFPFSFFSLYLFILGSFGFGRRSVAIIKASSQKDHFGCCFFSQMSCKIFLFFLSVLSFLLFFYLNVFWFCVLLICYFFFLIKASNLSKIQRFIIKSIQKQSLDKIKPKTVKTF